MSGRVVTFYSYKGGVGRSFLLANVAVVLSRWGYRVLCVDWDLDAPGLDYYFRPFAPVVRKGLLDLVVDLDRDGYVETSDYTIPVAAPDTRRVIDFVPAGREDDEYVRGVQRLDWDAMFDQHDFGRRLQRVREQWADRYDVVLVDSRTGINDIGGICTVQLPDTIVGVFTANEQSLRGVLDVVRRAGRARSGLPLDLAQPAVVPVLSRFDAVEEYDRANEHQNKIAKRVAPLFDWWAHRGFKPVKLLSHLTVPYVARWTFGEDLAVVEEPDPRPAHVSYAVETLAALLAQNLDGTDLLLENRDSFVNVAAQARRDDSRFRHDVFLSYSGRDRTVARELAASLRDAGLRVFFDVDSLVLGSRWVDVMEQALDSARHLVVLLRADSPEQSREIESFGRRVLDERSDRRILPVLLPGGKPPAKGLLSSLQYVDVGKLGLERAATAIVSAVRR